MFGRIKFWLECSRWYALPMSIFSWLIIFSYSLRNDGNALYGCIALIGICFAHLATNLFDDFFDYRALTKEVTYDNKIVLPNTQRGKCRYIIDNKVSLSEVLSVVGLYCLLSLFVGMFFYFIGYEKVFLYVIIGAFIVLFYSFLSYIRLSEVAVGIAFGPLLFSGVNYVMTGDVSCEALILSIPSMIFTINLIFTDTVLDKNIDKNEGKHTLAGSFKSDTSLFKFHQLLMTAGYLSVFLIPVFDIADWEVFLVYLTIPLAYDLFKSLKSYAKDTNNIPVKKWFHFPFEAWDDIKTNRSETFMFRMYQARNLMIYFSVILAVSLWFN